MHIWTETPWIEHGDLLDHTSAHRLDLAESTPCFVKDKAWWSVLIELADASIDMFAEAARAHAADYLIPVAYDAQDRSRVSARQPVAIYARHRFVIELNRRDNPFHVAGVHLGAITRDRTLDFCATPPDLSPIHVQQDAVVTAVIDDGIAIAHDLLRKGPTRSRVEHVTLLDSTPVPGGKSSVGRALQRDEIDSKLAQWTSNGLLDEDGFYRSAGVIDWTSGAVSPVARRSSHGTFVTALAAGEPMSNLCETRPVICAALPARLIEDTTGVDSLPVLYLALHILSKQARRFCTPDGNPAPVIFNFSFGNTGGPHDGTGLFPALFEHYFGAESALNAVRQTAWLMLPAGNVNLTRLHAVAEGSTQSHLDLTVQPDDHTPSEVQIWLPTGTDDTPPSMVDVRVTTPWGQSGAITSTPGQSVSLVDGKGALVAHLSCQRDVGATHRMLMTLFIHPTAACDAQVALAPAGSWALDISRSDGPADEPLNIWIRRDETLPGTRSGGRQAWFSNPDYTRFGRFGAPLPVDPENATSPVRRAGTLSGFATGASPVVVAAYTERDARLSAYSSAGPLAPRGRPPTTPRDGPDLAAKGDDSHLLRGVIGAGSASGSWVRLSGTSVAAPRVARLAACNIREWSGNARDWSHWAVSQSPFHLAPDTDKSRTGAGGIDIPLGTGSHGQTAGPFTR